MQLISGALQRSRAGRDRDLVLARQVRVVGVAVEELRRLLDDRRRVEELVVGEPGDRAAGDVAHRVAAAAGGGQPGGVEPLEDLGQRAELDPVQLDVLARRQLAVAAAERVRDLADRAQLRRRDAGRPGSLIRSMNVPTFGLSW